MRVINLPNTLTAARIVLIPVFITALEYGRYKYAFYIFAFGAASDMLDGLMARLKDQRTPLGTVLDPLADKFMLVTSYVFFAHFGWIPAWLTIIVLSRDIIIIAGCIIIYLVNGALKVEPTVLGKASTVVQFALLCLVLVEINFRPVPGLKDALVWGAAGVTGLSGLHYIYKGLKITGGK